MLSKIISGGQTGADRGGLEAALFMEMEYGGWCPKGRKAEDGVIPLKYFLAETPSSGYAQRTKANIEIADGTVIFWVGSGALTGGTLMTWKHCLAINKPTFLVRLGEDGPNPQWFRDWLKANEIGILNVAGPRESKFPGIQDKVREFLVCALSC